MADALVRAEWAAGEDRMEKKDLLFLQANMDRIFVFL
jgi:hypothetical protein